MYCSNCGNKNKEEANFCINCGIKIDIITHEETDVLEYLDNNPDTIVKSDTNEVINDNKDKNFTKKVFNGIGVGGAYIGGGILLLILTVVRFLYIASAGISMVWASIALFKSGSIFLGIVVLLIGTPVAISIASYFFLPLLLFSILTLIVWGIASILGFDISFSNVWDMLWFGVKILILGAIAFWGISSFIKSVRENKTLNFFKENWFYILIFLFIFWLFFINGSKKDTYLEREEINSIEETSPSSDTYVPSWQKNESTEKSIFEGEENKVSSDWITYTSKEDNFKILFPNNPQLIIGSPNDVFKINNYAFEDKDSGMSFLVKSFTPIATDNHNKKDVDEILKITLDLSLLDNEKIISSNYGYNKNHRVLNYTKLSSTNITTKGQIIYTGQDPYTLGDIYLLMVIYRKENYKQEIYNKFINSFKIL